MKNVLLLTILSCVLFTANAQDYDKPFYYKQQMYSIGIGGGISKYNTATFTIDMVICGGLVGFDITDDGYREGLACINVGYFIPIYGFSNKKNDDFRHGWSKALLIAPLVVFNNYLYADGHKLHNDEYHSCKVWVDTSYGYSGKTGYGLALLYRFDYGTLTCKMTTSAITLSIGLGL